MEEPAYEGVSNGISVRVTKKEDTDDHGHQEQHSSAHQEPDHAVTSDSVEAHGSLLNSAVPTEDTFEFIASDGVCVLNIALFDFGIWVLNSAIIIIHYALPAFVIVDEPVAVTESSVRCKKADCDA